MGLDHKPTRSKYHGSFHHGYRFWTKSGKLYIKPRMSEYPDDASEASKKLATNTTNISNNTRWSKLLKIWGLAEVMEDNPFSQKGATTPTDPYSKKGRRLASAETVHGPPL